MTRIVPRRALQFADLASVLADAERLHAAGYERAGNWDLAQVCGHVAEWMRFPVAGYPRSPLPVRPLLWGMQRTIGRMALREILTTGTMRRGVFTLQSTMPAPGGDEAAAIERLRRAIAQFESHTGPWPASPYFGPLDAEGHRRLQLVHCAHHLSFLVPRSEAERSACSTESE